MNCMALEQRGEILLVDCGVTFDDRNIGVDVIHPDFSPIGALGDRLVGVVVTHGHEDHIGALPYLLARYDVPVWAPRYALGLIRERAREHEMLAHARFFETRPREAFDVGSFRVEPIRVTHSIADATALAITTDEGTIVHSGDFKFDESPPDGESFDEERLRELGDAGVTLLMSDSTNIDVEGATGSEAGVGDALDRLVEGAPNAVVVTMFASNVHRLRLLGDIARRHGRKIVLLGRGVDTHARVARTTGYLPWPDDLVWPSAAVRELPRSRILAIATGSQGEARAALARLARGEHPTFDVVAGDRVVVSARTIPGNEPEVHALLNQLVRRGCDVRSRLTDRDVHVSGHAHRPDQRRMLELVRPHSFVPVHGTLHHLMRHGELARGLGVPNVAVVENGRVVEVSRDGVALGGNVPTGRVHVFAGRPLTDDVLRQRRFLAEEGVVSCVVTFVTKGDGRGEIADVALKSLGVVDEAHDAATLEEARHAVRRAVGALGVSPANADVEEQARLAVRRTFFRARGWKPMTIVHVVTGPRDPSTQPKAS